MRVLVTGARGFLGGAVVDATLRRGHDVRVLVRPRQSVDDRPWGNAVSVAAANLRHDDLAVALDEVDVVVHLAARVLGSPEERFASTVAGTERLLAALPGTDVRRVLLASTISVYDFTRGSAVIDEDHPVKQNLYARDPYAVAKVWQERVAREACDGAPWDLVTLRPGMIWGAGTAVKSPEPGNRSAASVSSTRHGGVYRSPTWRTARTSSRWRPRTSVRLASSTSLMGTA